MLAARIILVIYLTVIWAKILSATVSGSRKSREMDINRQAKTTELFTQAFDFLNQVNWAALALTVIAALSGHVATIWSRIKYISIAYGLIYLVFTLAAWFHPGLTILPSYLGLPPATPILRSLKSNIEEMDLGRMIRAIESVNLESSFQYMGIKEPQCQKRAGCELREYMTRNYPNVVSFVGLAASNILGLKKYGGTLRNGSDHTNCQLLNSDCLYSPIEKLRLRWSGSNI